MFSPVESNQGFNFKPELPTSSAYYRLLKKLRRQVGHAIRDFKMIEEGDKVMVCISGGKDSYTLLDIMLQFKRIAPQFVHAYAVALYTALRKKLARPKWRWGITVMISWRLSS